MRLNLFFIATLSMLPLACKQRHASTLKAPPEGSTQTPEEAEVAAGTPQPGPVCGGAPCAPVPPEDAALADLFQPLAQFANKSSASTAWVGPTSTGPDDAQPALALGGGEALATTEDRDRELAAIEAELKKKHAQLAEAGGAAISCKSIPCIRGYEIQEREIDYGPGVPEPALGYIRQYTPWVKKSSGYFKMRAFYRTRLPESVQALSCGLLAGDNVRPPELRQKNDTEFRRVFVKNDCSCSRQTEHGDSCPETAMETLWPDPIGNGFVYVAQMFKYEWMIPPLGKNNQVYAWRTDQPDAAEWCAKYGWRLPTYDELTVIGAAVKAALESGKYIIRDDKPYLWTNLGRNDAREWYMVDWKTLKITTAYEGYMSYKPVAHVVCIR